VEGSDLVLTYNNALDRARVFLEINPQRANFVLLEPQIGTWTMTELVIDHAHVLDLSITNNGSASGYFSNPLHYHLLFLFSLSLFLFLCACMC
jgi:hypothetical protein